MTLEKIPTLQPEDIRNARIDGMLCRAEETGRLNGMRKGKRKIILTLLESMDIEEVSKVTKLSIKEIEELTDYK